MHDDDAVLVRALVQMLGPVGVVGAGGEVRLGAPKERCLLAVLTLQAGVVVAEDRLLEALWLGSPPRTAAKTLQNYVLRLRRRLDGCGDAAIITRPPGYLLEGVDVAIDLGGTVTGEHGVGVLKLDGMRRELGPIAVATQRAIKPPSTDILNPGKMVG